MNIFIFLNNYRESWLKHHFKNAKFMLFGENIKSCRANTPIVIALKNLSFWNIPYRNQQTN